ncbi:MAG: metal ABC transporter permease [Clostridiales bacterium]|nr:metal ABC transporter permease [Clostridiales bacterium]
MSFFETLYQMLSYTFMQRALIVGVLIALCSSLLGVSLVLKRYSMIGDGLSHVGFGTLAVASALNLSAPLELAVPVVIAAAFFLLKLSENSKIKGDSAIAILSSSAMAIGIVVTSVSTGLNADIENYLFGSILAMSQQDMIMCIILAIVVIGMFILFYNRIFAVTFDETFAKATGTAANVYNMIIAVLTALTIVIGMKIMGTLLISSLIIFPALTSMRVCKRFFTVIICSAVVAVVSFVGGIVTSYFFSTAAGATVVIVNLIFFLAFTAVQKIRNAERINK